MTNFPPQPIGDVAPSRPRFKRSMVEAKQEPTDDDSPPSAPEGCTMCKGRAQLRSAAAVRSRTPNSKGQTKGSRARKGAGSASSHADG